MKSQKEAERAEQQRIKNLVLNYDLQESSSDQTGTETTFTSIISPVQTPISPRAPLDFLL